MTPVGWIRWVYFAHCFGTKLPEQDNIKKWGM